jgi:hypothetical protein
MSYDAIDWLRVAKEIDAAKKINSPNNNEYERYVKNQLNAIYGVRGIEMTEMRAGDFDGDMPCIDKEAYKMIINDIITLLRERYGISYSKVRMKVGLHHSDVFPAIDVDISRSECAITKVIFNDPATIVFWSDNTKTVVKCGDADIFDKEKGLAMAICKKAMGNKGNYYEEFKKWIPELKVDDNASTSEAAIWSYDDIMKAAQSYGEQLAKEIRNRFDILGIKLSEEVETND